MKYLITILMLSMHLLSQAQSHGQFLEAVRTLAADKRYHAADSLISKGLLLFPNDHDLLCSRARIISWQGDYEQADSEANRVLLHYPHDHEAYQIKARISYWSGSSEKLLTQAQEYLTVYPEDDEFKYYEAYAYHKLGMTDKSKTLIEQLLASNPTHEATIKLRQSIRSSHYSFADAEVTYASFSEALEPWKQIRLGYGQNQKLPWNVHLTGVERFNTKGWALQAEAYPRLSKQSYVFIETTYSPNSFMANYTAGLEVFQGVGDFEFSLGTKRFSFVEDKFFMYKASLGLYKKSFFVHYQALYSQAQQVNNYTHILRLRTYLGPHQYLEGELVSGTNAQEYVDPEGNVNLMVHQSAGVKYSLAINDHHNLQFRVRARNEEYRSELFRTRIDFQVGYQIKMF